MGLLSRYNRATWDEMQDLLQHLPEEYKKRGENVVNEGRYISNATIKCALDGVDTAARGINTSVMLRRHAWLRISGFKPELQQHILNVPFDGEQVFGPAVDTQFEKIKKNTNTAKSMGAFQTIT